MAYEGINYEPLRINRKRAQDALYELSEKYKRMLPDNSEQQRWITEALDTVFQAHPRGADFCMDKAECNDSKEDVLYQTLEHKLGVRV